MENDITKKAILIAEELAKEIYTQEESTSALLQEWKKEHPDFQKQLLSKEELSSNIAFYEHVDTEAACQEIHKQLFPSNHYTLYIRIGSIAALMLLLFSIGNLLFPSDDNKTEETIPTWAMAIPGNENSSIVTSDNQIFKLEDPILFVQDNYIINGNGEKKIQITITQDQGPQLNKLDVPAGGEHKLTLADGSIIKVNSASELWFPTDFGESTRQIQLQGEAYFQVKADEVHPFIVTLSNDLKVRVTGTTFNINAYKEEKTISIALVEGKIDILKKSKKLVSLAPGEIFTFQKDNLQYNVNQTDLTHITDWTSDIFIFRDEPIENIMRKLSRWYNVEINVHNEIKDIRYTGVLSRKQPLNETLEAIRMTNEVNIEIQKNKIVNIADKNK